ncbi:HutD/Ves family protein [Paracoccus aminophilus]|uniref:HutD-family protein n=1 Tax=Paracoccus aminophilus JCM 7686 TaxID=1367847 RepID=S5Y9X9_PARAH|nr:HutD family protein [Paracoccus aminophilus]AGT08183.1 hypothetical protein JCM7686_1074 [Paracoccus aminophilus JCM 7686]
MTLLRAEDHRRMPWKNGKGITIEIAIHPEGASTDDFDWRLSTASVATDGPFSVFPGIDRSLSVLEGDGILLAVEGLGETELRQDTAPFSFPADAPTSARLIGSEITDLNAMSRRGRVTHRLTRHEIAGEISLPVSGETCLIFCGTGRVEVAGTALGKLDCLRLERPEAALQARGTGTLYLVSFDPV